MCATEGVKRKADAVEDKPAPASQRPVRQRVVRFQSPSTSESSESFEVIADEQVTETETSASSSESSAESSTESSTEYTDDTGREYELSEPSGEE